jgi:hypothetical protein
MSTTMERSSARTNRAFAAINPAMVETLNKLAARATVMNDGFVVTQRQVHDALLVWAIAELGEDGAARLGHEAARLGADPD